MATSHFKPKSGKRMNRWDVLLEVSSVTVAGSLLFHVVRAADPARHWLVPVIWLYLPLLPLRLRCLSFSSHGYSMRQWTRLSGRAIGVGLGILVAYAALVSGWQAFSGRPLTLSRHGLSFEIILTQLVLVAIPEELFFRGYVQERLRHGAAQSGWAQQPTAILLGATLFALAHVLVAPSWWRAAIFFPGCVMGWLRMRSQGLLIPTLFHWLANLLSFTLHS